MSSTTTVVFADLTGSTSVFEALGNELATQVITTLTGWIGGVCESYRGRVVKTLGDGVMVVFADGTSAIQAVVELHRVHSRRIREWPNEIRMRLQVGAACGEIVEVEGDCYGDAVNVASRLSDLSGADQIWATDSVVSQIRSPPAGVRFRNLGPIRIRGKTEARVIFRVEWQEDVLSVNITQPAPLEGLIAASQESQAGIQLSWLDQQTVFDRSRMPIHLGRDQSAHFVVEDQRVSRLHARIDWRNGGLVLTDISSYGSWLRFNGSATVLALRRNECVLHGDGEIALGASFDDFTVPTVSFRLIGGDA